MSKKAAAPVLLEQTERIALNLHDYDAGLKRLRIEASWEFDPETRAGVEPIEASLICFLLGRNGETREDEDFVFYNNPQGAQLAVRLFDKTTADMGDTFDDVLVMDFEQMPYDIWSVALVVGIYQGVQRDQTFDTLRHGLLVFKNEDTGQELCRIPFKGWEPQQTALKIVQLERTGTSWNLQELREGSKEGVGPMATAYGLQIASVS